MSAPAAQPPAAPAGLAADSRPRLPAGVRLRFDERRQSWVLLAPERALFPDAIAAEILRRCDGAASVEAIAGELAAQFGAPLDTVRADTLELLADLREKGYLEA